MSNIKDTNKFLLNFKDLKEKPENATLVTVDVVGLYPSTSYNEGLVVLKTSFIVFMKNQ